MRFDSSIYVSQMRQHLYIWICHPLAHSLILTESASFTLISLTLIKSWNLIRARDLVKLWDLYQNLTKSFNLIKFWNLIKSSDFLFRSMGMGEYSSKIPYLAKRVVLKNLNLLKSKNDDFWEHLPICQKKVSNDKINEKKSSFRRKIPSFGWILSKKEQVFARFAALKFLSC